MKAKALGYKGEVLVAQFLKSKGYEIIGTNVTFRGGEIDLVARFGDLLIFVEVKTRMYKSFGEGSESVDSLKKYRLARAIELYLSRHAGDRESDYRVDVVEVCLDSQQVVKNINHFEDIEMN